MDRRAGADARTRAEHAAGIVDDPRPDGLAPGDCFIDTTTTMFQVLDYHLDGYEPWQIEKLVGLTFDQVAAALAYFAQHRVEREAAYRADRRATAQHWLATLQGSYCPQWQDWSMVLGGIGVGIVLLVIGSITAYPVVATLSWVQDIVALLISAGLSLFCGIVGLGMVGVGSRFLVDLSGLHYEVSATMLTATRYGRTPPFAIPIASVRDCALRGSFLYVTCDDGTIYQLLGLKQLRDAVNGVARQNAPPDGMPPGA